MNLAVSSVGIYRTIPPRYTPLPLDSSRLAEPVLNLQRESMYGRGDRGGCCGCPSYVSLIVITI